MFFDSLKSLPPIDVVPLVGVLAMCAMTLVNRLSRKSLWWTCAITTLVYAGVASDGNLLGVSPLVILYYVLWGFFCAGVPVLVAAVVSRSAQRMSKLPRLGLMSLLVR
ncbi:MAG TPA: hypothetical protein VNX15_03895 [Gemmatimonadales bacterium]|jgi:hypothetical protein|nr:hypothetical protein [Gemmatimonadales bacterium]